MCYNEIGDNMKTNKELIIAICVGIIMVAFCLFMVFGKGLMKLDTSNLKVYKLNEIPGVDLEDETIPDEEKYVYTECSVAPQDKEFILKQFNTVIAFKIEQTKAGANIKGNYKIVNGEDFIAFDGSETHEIYSSKTNRVHSYNNEIYEKVINACKQYIQI